MNCEGEVMDYFDRSKEFWKTAGSFPLNKEELYPLHSVVQEFDLHHNKWVVEWGCGAGSDTLSYLHRDNHVAFCDIVPENIEITERNVRAAGFKIGQGDYETSFGFACPVLLKDSEVTPLNTESWDIVSSHGVLHHIPDPCPIVSEFHRILKPGGLLYIMLYTEHAARHFSRAIEQLTAARGISRFEAFGWCMDGEGCPYAKPYLESEGCDLLDQAGFKVEKVTLYNNDFFRTYKGVKLK